jgi:hypothetical protein
MNKLDAGWRALGDAAVDGLAERFAVAPSEVEAAVEAVEPEVLWVLERETLSRGGLANVIEALGSKRYMRYLHERLVVNDEAALREEGHAILKQVLHSKGRSRAIAARAARRVGVSPSALQRMLPGLVAIVMARLGERAQTPLNDILLRLPPIVRAPEGTNPYLPLADIMRRGCGVGPYARPKLVRVVRRAVAGAAEFRGGGPLGFFTRALVRLGSRPLQRLAGPSRPSR